MLAPMFDTCMLCGRRTRKPGEALCITHEIEALISLSYERMRERIRGNIPARRAGIGVSNRNVTNGYEDPIRHEM